MAAKLTNELAGLSSGCDIKRCVHEDGIYQFFIDYPKVNPLCPSCGSAHAHICIDTFHVIEKLHDAMNAIRCAEENQAKEEGDTDRYQLFFRLRRTLTTDWLNAEMKWGSRKAYNEKRLKEAFNASPALSECYEMLQNFQAILHEEKYESRVLLLGNWINTYRESEHADIVHAVKTVIRWKGYILNAWRYGKSNGPAEGMSNNIKVKKRIAYG